MGEIRDRISDILGEIREFFATNDSEKTVSEADKEADKIRDEVKGPVGKLEHSCAGEINIKETGSTVQQTSNDTIQSRLKYKPGGVRRKMGEQGEAATPDRDVDDYIKG